MDEGGAAGVGEARGEGGGEVGREGAAGEGLLSGSCRVAAACVGRAGSSCVEGAPGELQPVNRSSANQSRTGKDLLADMWVNCTRARADFLARAVPYRDKGHCPARAMTVYIGDWEEK